MKRIALVLAVGIVATLDVRADVLASFTIDGSVRSSFDTNPNSSASDLIDGAGITSIFDTGRGNPTPSLSVVSTIIDGSTNAAAVTANDYVTFTITPSVGFMFNLTSLTFDFANYSNDGTFPSESFFLRSSLNGFSANVGSTQATAADGVFATANISLAGATFQGVASAIEFRIYFQDGTTDADRGALLDNVILNGSVAPIPEPATYLLFGMGLLACAQRFRRAKSR